ncbi:MAG: hypothetical protein IPK60_15525 [Sandaracinaceae bacterium]|jgi:hypothetical protein|nr:hypothetical protein [Sandaracinaceae bacterium]
MDANEFESSVKDIETRLDRLKALYEQWFQGLERLEPMIPRKEVDRRIAQLRREHPRNTALRFRFQQLLQRYTTLTTYWLRVARQIEEGTYRRDVMRLREKRIAARNRSGRPSAPSMEVPIELDLEGEAMASEGFAGGGDLDAEIDGALSIFDEAMRAPDRKTSLPSQPAANSKPATSLKPPSQSIPSRSYSLSAAPDTDPSPPPAAAPKPVSIPRAAATPKLSPIASAPKPAATHPIALKALTPIAAKPAAPPAEAAKASPTAATFARPRQSGSIAVPPGVRTGAGEKTPAAPAPRASTPSLPPRSIPAMPSTPSMAPRSIPKPPGAIPSLPPRSIPSPGGPSIAPRPIPPPPRPRPPTAPPPSGATSLPPLPPRPPTKPTPK